MTGSAFWPNCTVTQHLPFIAAIALVHAAAGKVFHRYKRVCCRHSRHGLLFLHQEPAPTDMLIDYCCSKGSQKMGTVIASC